MTENLTDTGRLDRRQFLAGAAASVAMAELVIMPGRARGQAWPERPITLVSCTTPAAAPIPSCG